MYRSIYRGLARPISRAVYGGAYGAQLVLYFDPDYAGGGNDGSYAAPYTSFSELNTLAGTAHSLDRATLRLKSGATFLGTAINLGGNGHTRLTIEVYGGSPVATIDAMAAWSPGWTNLAGNVWYTNSNPGAYQNIVVAGVNMRRAESQAIMDATAVTAWYGTHSGNAGAGNRLYINRAGGDPGAVRRSTNTNALVINAGNCPGLSVTGIRLQGGYTNNILISGASDNFLLDEVESRWCGGGTGGRNCFNIAASTDGSVVINGATIRACRAYDNEGDANNNGFEISYLNNATFDGCYIYRIRGNAYELWNRCDNTLIKKSTSYDNQARLLWLSPGDGVEGMNHTGTRMENSVHRSAKHFNNTATAGGSDAVTIQCGSNTVVVNNTFYLDNLAGLRHTRNPAYDNAGNGRVTFVNNIVRHTHVTSPAQSLMMLVGDANAIALVGALTADNQCLVNYNHYFKPFGSNENFNRNGAVGTLAVWQANGGDANSGVADYMPGFRDVAAAPPDLTPQCLNWGVGRGTSTSAPTDDYNGATRGATVDIGAIQRTGQAGFYKPKLVKGFYDGANNDGLVVAATASDTGTFTIAFVTRRDPAGQSFAQVVLGCVPYTAGIEISTWDTNQIRVHMRWSNATTSDPLFAGPAQGLGTPNRAYHVAIVGNRASNYIRIYIDGVLYATNAWSVAADIDVSAAGNWLQVGAYNNGAQFGYRGELGDIYFSLSELAIETMFANGEPTDPTTWGGSPLLLLNGDAADLNEGVNAGSAGTMTPVGTLTLVDSY